MFLEGSEYSRKEIWSQLHPNEEYPGGGNWTTGYVKDQNQLIVFANIGTPGRTGHDFPNEYDHETQIMIWYGKPNAHSGQPTIKLLLEGKLVLQVFARWNSDRPLFTYLGVPTIDAYQDNVKTAEQVNTIKFTLHFNTATANSVDAGPDGYQTGAEGKLLTVTVNKYERDPALRAACIEAHGSTCKICGFDFEATYGDLGKGFCHIHHIKPLAENDQEVLTNPITDLIPLCPNCHAMIHRSSPALTPETLKLILNKHSQ